MLEKLVTFVKTNKVAIVEGALSVGGAIVGILIVALITKQSESEDPIDVASRIEAF